ncbi:unannotated protein [freshwater metagenome]|uniref:Unannotated protein n=1 Tax=freshwater metagenome TaxID=449393 RepID=A0A6J6NXN4_9ZZZZ
MPLSVPHHEADDRERNDSAANKSIDKERGSLGRVFGHGVLRGVNAPVVVHEPVESDDGDGDESDEAKWAGFGMSERHRTMLTLGELFGQTRRQLGPR